MLAILQFELQSADVFGVLCRIVTTLVTQSDVPSG
jgi:hypothetical protein